MIKTSLRLAVLLLPLVIEPAAAATLLDIYERALLSDPQLREAEANRLAAIEAKPQAIALLLPQVDATANYDDQTSTGSRVTSFGGVPATTVFDNQTDGWTWGVQLRQTLFRWDQFVQLRQASKEVAKADIDYRSAQQDLIVRVARAYFDVLAAQDTLESEQAAKEAIGRQLEQAKKRFEVGLIAITDVQEAQAAYDDAVAAEIVAKRSLANQREVLREITGQYTKRLAAPREQIPLLAPDPADENQWVEVALQQNAALLSADLAAEIARHDVDIARNGHLPTVDLVVGYRETDVSGTGVSSGTALPNPITSPLGTESEDESISVQFALPLFSGGAVSSRVKQASYRHRAAKEQLERVARETERQARDAYLGVISEISRVKALRQALASAQTALEATEAGFEVGTRTTVDVLDARRALLLAETNYARSRYDYIINVLLLKQAAGTLTAADLAEINGWLDSGQPGS
ncbi:MAG: type I secretion protein TolC [Gammaproteobacteria bacterium]|nr:MAG: type I secretion protein TolC [Gammaproteobacteria bacterium]